VLPQPQIRTVDLGPFKHKIDDGLELRKAAFECLDILLTALPHVLQVLVQACAGRAWVCVVRVAVTIVAAFACVLPALSQHGHTCWPFIQLTVSVWWGPAPPPPGPRAWHACA
jgi:hypothetical protein